MRWCAALRQSGQLTLMDVRSVALPSEDAARSEAIRKTLREGLLATGAEHPTVLTALPKHLVFLRVFDAPAVSRRDLEKILSLRVAQEVPNYSADLVRWGFEVLEHPSGKRSVALSAVRREALETFLLDFRAAGTEPDVVDVEPLALARWFVAQVGADQESLSLVDIGDQNTSLTMIQNGCIHSFSQLPVSHRDIMEAGATRFMLEVQSALQSTGEANPAAAIVLCGESRATRGLVESASRDQRIDSIENIVQRAHCSVLIPSARLDGNAHILESLAWRANRKSEAMTNLVAQKQWSASPGMQAITRRALSIPTLAIVTVALLAIFYFATNWMREQRTVAIEESLAAIRPLEPQLLRMEQTANVLKAYDKERFNWLEILSEISKLKPENMMLAQVKMDRSGKCSMQGEINGKTPIQIAEKFVSALNESPLFEQVQMGSIRSRQDSASFQVGFSISKTRRTKG